MSIFDSIPSIDQNSRRTPRGPPPQIGEFREGVVRLKASLSTETSDSLDLPAIQNTNQNPLEKSRIEGLLEYHNVEELCEDFGAVLFQEKKNQKQVQQNGVSGSMDAEIIFNHKQSLSPSQHRQDLRKKKNVEYRELLLKQIQQSAQRKRISKRLGILEEDVSFDDLKESPQNRHQCELSLPRTAENKDIFFNQMIDHEIKRKAQRKAVAILSAQQLREQVEENNNRKLFDKQLQLRSSNSFIFETKPNENSPTPRQSPQLVNSKSYKTVEGKMANIDQTFFNETCGSDRNSKRREARATYDVQLRQQIDEKVKKDHGLRNHRFALTDATRDLFGDEGHPATQGNIETKYDKRRKQLEYRELLNEQIEANRKLCNSNDEPIFPEIKELNSDDEKRFPSERLHDEKVQKQLEYLNLLSDQIKENARQREEQRRRDIEEELRFERQFREMLDQQRKIQGTCASRSGDSFISKLHDDSYCGISSSKVPYCNGQRRKQCAHPTIPRQNLIVRSRQEETHPKVDFEDAQGFMTNRQNGTQMNDISSYEKLLTSSDKSRPQCNAGGTSKTL